MEIITNLGSYLNSNWCKTKSNTQIDEIINFGLPHIAEQIFEYTTIDTLLQCRLVSKTWNEFAKAAILKRWEETFIFACKFGHIEVVELILQYLEWKQIELDVTDHNGKTGLMLACQEGWTDVVKLLLRHPKCQDIGLNARDHEGMTAFILACARGQRDVV